MVTRIDPIVAWELGAIQAKLRLAYEAADKRGAAPLYSGLVGDALETLDGIYESIVTSPEVAA